MSDARAQSPSTPAAAQPKPAFSALAIVAFVLSLVPLLLNLVGLVLGVVALVRISDRPRALRGKGLAIAAIAVGGAWMPLGIMAAIAIPNFVRYQVKAQQSEARIELKSAYTAQQAHYAELAQYAGTFAALGWKPSGVRQRYTFFLGDDVLPGEPPQVLPQGVESFARGDSFRIVAAANLDRDPELDLWAIDEKGELVNLRSDLR